MGFFRYGATIPGAYFLRRGLFLPEELPSLLPEPTVAEGLSTYDPRPLAARRSEFWR